MSKTLVKKIAGVGLIILGAASFLTPFTPFGWLLFAGLGLLGFGFLFGGKISKEKQENGAQQN